MAAKLIPGAIDYQRLVQSDRVHGSIYTSQAIFEEEVAKIFHRTWMYVGHASEVPEPGDYVRRTIGRTPVVLCRGEDRQLRLFINRCRHNGNALCQLEAGNVSFFRCAYHGWTYSTKGELTGVPQPAAYDESFRREDYGLTPVPRMGSYRGFVFGCLAPTEVTLDEFLGEPTKEMIDLFCDASPEGEIEVRGGALKVVYYGNWKFQGSDGYHGPVTHKRVFGDAQRRSTTGGFAVEGQNYSRDLGGGHGMLDTRETANKRLPDAPWAQAYREAMERAYGPERAAFLIRTNGDPHLIGFPNWHLVTCHVRIIIPVSATETQEIFQLARLKGVPPELNAMRVRQVQEFWGPAGWGNPDDVEMFERNMLGLSGELDPWSIVARGKQREQQDVDGSVYGELADEVTRRGQQKHWLKVMTQDRTDRDHAIRP